MTNRSFVEATRQHALNDLVARELLREDRREGRLRYFMRYPNHLTVLAQPDLRKTIGQHIAALRQGAGDAGYLPNLLPKSAMEDLRILTASNRGQDLPVVAGVVGASWVAALRHERGGIADRLGIPPDAVVDVATGGIRSEVLERPSLIVAGATAGTAADIVRRRDRRLPPPIILGDLDLLRWALKADRSGAEQIVVAYGLRRLPRGRIAWWFERLRNLDFADADAIDQIDRATSGIPILLGSLDDLLGLPLTGGEIGRDALARALAEFKERLPRTVSAIREGRSGLTARELELLRLAVKAAQVGDEFPFQSFLADQGLVSQLIPEAAAFGRTTEDPLAAEVLKLSGLLPLDDDGVVRLRPDDALKDIVAAIEAV